MYFRQNVCVCVNVYSGEDGTESLFATTGLSQNGFRQNHCFANWIQVEWIWQNGSWQNGLRQNRLFVATVFCIWRNGFRQNHCLHQMDSGRMDLG
jgi:hypothetical protein